MSNKQPFYHEISILLTATAELNGDVIREILERELPKVFSEVIPNSIELQFCEAEPGDPADLI